MAIMMWPHRIFSSSRFFYTVSGMDLRKKYVCEGSHHCVQDPMKNRRQLASFLKLKRMDVPPFAVFTMPECQHYSGAEYAGYLAMQCCILKVHSI